MAEPGRGRTPMGKRKTGGGGEGNVESPLTEKSEVPISGFSALHLTRERENVNRRVRATFNSVMMD